MAAARAEATSKSLLSIGQVLALLNDDFSDLTPSKLRFLEEQGLITPERTKSGYRKFGQAHIERLRMILSLQREHYMPLKVIAELLEDLDAGRDPVIPGSTARTVSSIFTPQRILSGAELCRLTGASKRFLGEAIAAGLLPAAEVFPHEAAAQLSSLLSLSERGISLQHLRALRVAAEREAELISHAVSSRGIKSATPKGVEESLEIAEHLDTVRSGVLRRRFGAA